MKIKNLKLKIIFLGSSKFVIPILEVLRKNFDLRLVLTTEKNATDAVPAYCIKNKIPYLSVQQFSNLTIQQLEKTKAPVGILADFGIIIPKQILNLFPKGIINIHPSLLPKYRGPTPVQTAILNGEKITGVSIIKLDEKVDHGPILGQEKEEILSTDTAETLYRRLFEKGANLLIRVLPKYIKGYLNPTEQNHNNATFTKPLTRQDGYLDISNATTAVTKIDRMIRAYFPWPGVWTKVQTTSNKKPLTTNSKKSEVRSQKLEVRIKFLPGNLIQVEGKKPISYKDFINGYPEAKKLLFWH